MQARLRIGIPVAAAAAMAAPATAHAGTWTVNGSGFGHGVGMSQYGAYGYAKRGFTYDQILGHYYTGTTLGSTQTKPVRVLLRSGGRFSFRGAGSACGQNLLPGTTYVALRKGSGVRLRTREGNSVANCGGVLSATASPAIELVGKGTYRGSLEIRRSGKGLIAVNVVDLEDYVRGVVPKESPSSWPLEALKAQAVAARSYVLATSLRGRAFDVYDDTRSQVYGGVRAETAKTNQAVDATGLQVVLYQGKVAQTYFFSTSGGHTENNEFSSLGFGGTPIPYLRGVDDPYEAEVTSPYAHWVRRFSDSKMASALRGLVRGKLRNIAVTQRGSSPRIVKANLIGSRGTTGVTGPTLRTRLGLPDTWADFTHQ